MHIEENPYRVDLTKYYRHQLPAGYDFRGHQHGTVEMNIILKGEMEITCGDSVVRAGQENILFVPSNAFHRNRVVGNENAEMLEVRFYPEKDTWLKEFSVYRLTEDLRSLMHFFCRDMDQNAMVVNGDCHRITENANMLLHVFLEYALREPEQVFQTEENAEIYRLAVQFMTKHVEEKLTMEQIARNVGVCCTTLKNVFSRYTGRGCMAYFEEMKLNRAKDYLIAGKTCAETAMTLSFSSQAHFSKRFFHMFGELPSRVRQSKS